MATLDEFKANLIGGGARANQFRVTFNTPGAIATGLDVRKASFLIKAAALPGQTIGEIAILMLKSVSLITVVSQVSNSLSPAI